MKKFFRAFLLLLLSFKLFSCDLVNPGMGNQPGNNDKPGINDPEKPGVDDPNKPGEDGGSLEETVSKNFIEFDKEPLTVSMAEGKGEPTSITFLSINDFHGQIEETEGEFGIARTASLLVKKHNANPSGTVMISAGDMFQGSGISNYRHGRDVVNILNGLGFEAMAIGNHEFDWGIEEVLKFRDSDQTNGESNFPFLACNIFNKTTGEPLANAAPYTIVERGSVKIGIIGFMGYGLESTIATI